MKLSFLTIVIVTAGLLLNGCSGWPHYGHGGVAEINPHAHHVQYRPLDIKRLNDMVSMAERDIAALKLAGAMEYYPAVFHKIALQYNRTIRETDGGLYAQADKDLTRLHWMLTDLTKKLEKRSMNLRLIKGANNESNYTSTDTGDPTSIL